MSSAAAAVVPFTASPGIAGRIARARGLDRPVASMGAAVYLDGDVGEGEIGGGGSRVESRAA